MTQHTAENIFPQIEGCTCTILGLRSLRDTIRLCPLHRAAPEMYALLKRVASDVEQWPSKRAHNMALNAVSQFIAKAEEGS